MSEETKNTEKGGISVEIEHIFPIIKKWLYSEKEIFLREFELFSYFFARPYITISRSELLKTIWKDENERGTNVVDVYIRFLRAKLDEKFGLRLIRSRRGEGYVYAPDDKVSDAVIPVAKPDESSTQISLI